MSSVVLLFLLDSGNSGTERLGNVFKDTQQINGIAGI